MHRALMTAFDPVVADLGYDLLLVELANTSTGQVLRVYIDHADGIDVDDCARVSHEVSGILDVEDPISGNYSLEVSSPGLDRPLVKPEHFDVAIGEDIKVLLAVPTLEGRKRFAGPLESRDGDTIVVRVDGEPYELPLGDIESARLIPDYQAELAEANKRSAKVIETGAE